MDRCLVTQKSGCLEDLIIIANNHVICINVYKCITKINFCFLYLYISLIFHLLKEESCFGFKTDPLALCFPHFDSVSKNDS